VFLFGQGNAGKSGCGLSPSRLDRRWTFDPSLDMSFMHQPIAPANGETQTAGRGRGSPFREHHGRQGPWFL
jgi:hypothetical protein